MSLILLALYHPQDFKSNPVLYSPNSFNHDTMPHPIIFDGREVTIYHKNINLMACILIPMVVLLAFLVLICMTLRGKS